MGEAMSDNLGLTPEEIDGLLFDRAVYGMALARLNQDGKMTRIPPEEWPKEVRPNFTELERIWGKRG
jgi:4-alpha-glucanotransferase